MQSKSNIGIIVYPRVGNHASRIFKQAEFLIDKKIVEEVLILSMFFDKNLAEEVIIGDKIKIKRIKTRTSGLPKNAFGDSVKFLEFTQLCKNFIKKTLPTIVIPHSLSVLPIGVWAKKKLKAKLIYDAHELETERFNLKGLRKIISQKMESKLIGFCDKVIVVNDEIAEWYRINYSIENVFSIPNIPTNIYKGKSVPQNSILRTEFGIPENSIIFIYQGNLARGRGIEELLHIFRSGEIPPDRVIVFMGFGEFVNEVIETSKQNKQVFYKPAVKPSEIINNTSGADVGLFFILEEMCLSYQLSLPNKFYEYAIAGLYICVNDKFPVMKRLIDNHHLGEVIESSQQSIKEFIQRISYEDIKTLSNASSNYRRDLDWDQNIELLEEIFN